MKQSRPIQSVSRWLTGFACGAVLAALITPAAAVTVRGEGATLDYQALASDIIVRGTCEEKATRFVNGNFVTTYKIRAKKYLKAPGKMSVTSDPVLNVSQRGGRVEDPIPLEQSSPMQAAIFPGEEVVLFLQSPDNAPGVVRSRYDSLRAAGTMKATPLMENYRLTTKNLSKFTVIRNPNTGREMVTRVNFDKYGLLPTSEAVENYVKALESNTPTIDVEKSGRTLRIPVGIDKPPARPARTIEEKIRRMRRFSANWDDFEFQVQDILQHPEKSGRIATLAGVETTTEPTKD